MKNVSISHTNWEVTSTGSNPYNYKYIQAYLALAGFILLAIYDMTIYLPNLLNYLSRQIHLFTLI